MYDILLVGTTITNRSHCVNCKTIIKKDILRLNFYGSYYCKECGIKKLKDLKSRVNSLLERFEQDG